MAMVAVTALSGAGQFTLFSYFAPYFSDVLRPRTEQSSLLLVWFGAFGVIGNLVLTRFIDRVGAHARGDGDGLPDGALVAGLAAGLGRDRHRPGVIPWALGCFSSNSAQQARLGAAAPALAPALIALNTSAIYLGQAAGAASGGWLIAHGGYGALAGSAWPG